MTFPDPDYRNTKDKNGLYEYRTISLDEMREPKFRTALLSPRSPMTVSGKFAKLSEQKIVLIKKKLESTLGSETNVYFVWEGKFSTDIFNIIGRDKLNLCLELLDPVDAEIKKLEEQAKALYGKAMILRLQKNQQNNYYVTKEGNYQTNVRDFVDRYWDD